MRQLSIPFKFLKPSEGLYLNSPPNQITTASQLVIESKVVKQASGLTVLTGECIREGFLCSGWWSKFAGQLWFIDETIVLYQKVKGGPVFIKELKGYTCDGHTINFQNLIVKNSNVKGFMNSIEAKFTQLWSDNSEQAK